MIDSYDLEGSNELPKASLPASDIEVSWGSKVTNSGTLDAIVKLSNVITTIRTNSDLKQKIEKLRTIKEEKNQKKYKQENLPYFVAATFKANRRLRSELISTELMIFDYDDLTEAEVKSKTEVLIKDPNVLCVFLSPRGMLKVIYRLQEEITDYRKYSAVYKYYAKKFKASLGIDPDKTSDVTRACFFSYDPDLYFNPNAVPLTVDIPSTNVLTQVSGNNTKINFSGIEEENLEKVEAAVKFLKNVNLDYYNWINCGFALTQHPEGRELFWELSNNKFYDDSAEEIDAKFDNLVATATGDIGYGTLIKIAQDNGFELDYVKTKSTPLNAAVTLYDELIKQFAVDDTRDPNKLLGYPLARFTILANNIDGIQPGLYFISAETNIGKTAFLSNLGLDILETNPEVTLIYFSLDDDKLKISYRLISILTELSYKVVKRGLQNQQAISDLIVDKREYLKDLIKNERIFIPDLAEIQHINQLEGYIKRYEDRKLVICIDGLYNLEVDNSSGIREENIQRANKVKMIVDKYRIPVLVTGELRKKTQDQSIKKIPTLHDLMESGKYGYNANIVWLLYPDKASDVASPDPLIKLKYEKNKISDYKEAQDIRFIRASGVMKEWSVNPISNVINTGGNFD